MMDLDEFQNEQSMEILGDVEKRNYRESKCNTEYGDDDDDDNEDDNQDDDDEYYDAVSQFRHVATSRNKHFLKDAKTNLTSCSLSSLSTTTSTTTSTKPACSTSSSSSNNCLSTLNDEENNDDDDDDDDDDEDSFNDENEFISSRNENSKNRKKHHFNFDEFELNQSALNQIQKFKNHRESIHRKNFLFEENQILVDRDLNNSYKELIQDLEQSKAGSNLMQSLMNKKLRDELALMRLQNEQSAAAELANEKASSQTTSTDSNNLDVNSYDDHVFSDSEQAVGKSSTTTPAVDTVPPSIRDENDSLLKKYIRQYTANQLDVSKSPLIGKYFTYSPSASSSKFAQTNSSSQYLHKLSEKEKAFKTNRPGSRQDETTKVDDKRSSTSNSYLNIDKFKTWPSKTTSNDSFKNLNQIDESPVHRPKTKSKSNSFESAIGDAANTTIDEHKATDKEMENEGKTDVRASLPISDEDEFINPVDRQILFQMTSTSQNSNSNSHHHNHLHFYHPFMHGARSSKTAGASDFEKSTTDAKSKNEDDEQEDAYNEDDASFDCLENDDEYDYESKDGIKSFNRSNSKKSCHRSSLETSSMDASRQSIKKKTKDKLRKVFNRFGRAVKHVQNKAEEVLNHDKDNSESESDDVSLNEASKTVKYKRSRANKGSYEYNKTQIVQILNNQPNSSSITSVEKQPVAQSVTSGQTKNDSNCIIWVMKFSPCGKLLATAGKDQLLKIWVLRSYHRQFVDLIKKHNPNSVAIVNNTSSGNMQSFTKSNVTVNTALGLSEEQAPFYSKPFVVFSGHTSDILDVSWSKNLFILSASSDKTCRLWHIYKNDCLCSFHHSSIISAICFHPKDDRYFISACIDGKFRLWNVAEKKVILWNDLNNLSQSNSNFITAVSFCQGGKTIAVGTFDGKCVLYHTEHLKYYSLIDVKSTRGRNSKGSKITGIEVFNNDENKILVTSNDSRIRLYDLRDLSLVCKYRGFSNSTVHIRASLSPDDKYIICGSKNKCTYLWKTNHHFSMLNSGRRDRNNYWERIQAHNAIVTCAIFSPKPQLILDQIFNTRDESLAKTAKSSSSHKEKDVHIFLSAAGCDGIIKVFINKLNMS